MTVEAESAPDGGHEAERSWLLGGLLLLGAATLLVVGAIAVVVLAGRVGSTGPSLLVGVPETPGYELVALGGLDALGDVEQYPSPVAGTPQAIRSWDPPLRLDGPDDGVFAVDSGGRLALSLAGPDGASFGFLEGEEWNEVHETDDSLAVWHLVAAQRFLLADEGEESCFIVESSGDSEELRGGVCHPTGPDHVAMIDPDDTSTIRIHDLDGEEVVEYESGIAGVPAFSGDGSIVYGASASGDQITYRNAVSGEELATVDASPDDVAAGEESTVVAGTVVGGPAPAALTMTGGDELVIRRTDLVTGDEEVLGTVPGSRDPEVGLAVTAGDVPRLLVWSDSRAEGLRVWTGDPLEGDLELAVDVGDYRLAAASSHTRTGEIYLTIAPGIDLGGRATELHVVSPDGRDVTVVGDEWSGLALLTAATDGSTVLVSAQSRNRDESDLVALADGTIEILDEERSFGPALFVDGDAVYNAVPADPDEVEIRRAPLSGGADPEVLADELALIADLESESALARVSLESGLDLRGATPEPCLDSRLPTVRPGDEADGEILPDRSFSVCITVPATGEVDLRVRSDIDTTLSIEDADGHEVAYSDDEYDFDPAYEDELEAGTYVVIVESYAGDETGEATLTFDTG